MKSIDNLNVDESQKERPVLKSINDIVFELALDGDSQDEEVLQILSSRKLSEDEIIKKAQEEVKRKSWWLEDYWQEKGIPIEQFIIKINGVGFEVYNYGEKLTEAQVHEMNRTLDILSQTEGQKPRYVLIDNKNTLNIQNNEDERGYAKRIQNAIILRPRAMSNEPHRIPNTSSLVGTLIHEFGHFLQQNPQLQNEWIKRFGWKILSSEEMRSRYPKQFETQQESRCVTDYAKFSQDEDICESLVAAIRQPEILDKEKLDFIIDKFLNGKLPNIESAKEFERKSSEEVTMPLTPEKIKYRIKETKFRITS